MRRMWNGNGNEKNVYKVTAYGVSITDKSSSEIAAEWITEDANEAIKFYDQYCRDYFNFNSHYNYTITMYKNDKMVKTITV